MKEKLLHVKKLIGMTTTCLTEIVNNSVELVEQIEFPAEFGQRGDEAALREVSAQESMMKLLELNMEMRKELIYLGISYGKKAENES